MERNEEMSFSTLRSLVRLAVLAVPLVLSMLLRRLCVVSLMPIPRLTSLLVL